MAEVKENFNFEVDWDIKTMEKINLRKLINKRSEFNGILKEKYTSIKADIDLFVKRPDVKDADKRHILGYLKQIEDKLGPIWWADIALSWIWDVVTEGLRDWVKKVKYLSSKETREKWDHDTLTLIDWTKVW